MRTEDKSRGKEERVERLHDDLTGSEVLAASLREQRPTSAFGSVCPFCPGSESMTPPALWQDIDPVTQNWRIRIFENRFPILSRDQASGAHGVHEVIVETPRHDALLDDLSVSEISRIFMAIRSRMKFHKDNPALKVLFAFRNQGARGGASLAHPHSQLAGLSWIPDILASETRGFLAMAEQGTCPLCMEPANPLIVLEEGSMRAFSPRVPRFPREIWIAPVHHEPSFMDIKDTALDDLASLLKKILRALSAISEKGKPTVSPEESATILKGLSYNLVLHTEPLDDDSGTFHTHIEILPRPAAIAGFELGSGVMVNPVGASDSVSDLKEMLLSSDLTERG